MANTCKTKCKVGWFPFLFYSTTWIGETWLRYDAPPEMQNSKDTLGDIGRIGSLSLIVFSIVTAIASLALPWLVRSPEDDEKPGYTARPPPSLAPIVDHVAIGKPSLLTAWVCGHLMFAAAMVFAPFVASVRFATFLVAACGM